MREKNRTKLIVAQLNRSSENGPTNVYEKYNISWDLLANKQIIMMSVVVVVFGRLNCAQSMERQSLCGIGGNSPWRGLPFIQITILVLPKISPRSRCHCRQLEWIHMRRNGNHFTSFSKCWFLSEFSFHRKLVLSWECQGLLCRWFTRCVICLAQSSFLW